MRKRSEAALLFGLLALANPAFGATMAHPNPPDPLLDGGPTTACAAGADYTDGTDVTGNAVAPADVAQPKIPVPGNVAMPLHGGKVNPATGAGNAPYVSLDAKQVDKLVNPPPCR